MYVFYLVNVSDNFGFKKCMWVFIEVINLKRRDISLIERKKISISN